MSNSQPNPILQRIVGGVFLLALILLVAILLLKPSDNQISNADSGSNRPTITTPGSSKPQDTSNNRPPVLVLESNTIKEEEKITELPNNIEIVGDDIWQQVEEKTSETIVSEKPTLIAGTETPSSTQERSATSQKPQTTPKPKAETPKPSTPKLELIANSEKTSTQAPTNPPKGNNAASGQWFVQIGAFGNLANAQKLVSEYQKQGYSVRIQKDKNLNRVQIGPFSTQKAAEQVKAKTKTPSINPAVIHFP